MVTETASMPAAAHGSLSTEVAPDAAGDARVSQTPPTPADLARVAETPLLTASHESVTFGSLFPKDAQHRTLICFVRHFFCGYCQEFLRTLCSSIPPQALATASQPTSLVIIGCGQPDLIEFYAETTACPYPIYAEPTKKLYHELGMCRTLDLGPTRPEYQQKSMASMMLSSVSQATRAGRNAFKGGDFSQVGGEFLLQGAAPPQTQDAGCEPAGPDVVFCHRMRNTRDHVQVPVLRHVLGLPEEAAPVRKKRASLAFVPAALARRASRSRSRSRVGSETASANGSANGIANGNANGNANKNPSVDADGKIAEEEGVAAA